MAVTEKLIQTVYAYPVLYNVSLHDYRSSERRVNAWREVAASVGLSVVECKRRWKTIRDRYIRERRLCKLKREEGGRRLHYWPHRESLSFLDAHIRKRKRLSAGSAPEDLEDGSALDSPEESLLEPSLELKAPPVEKPELRAAPLQLVPQLAPIRPLLLCAHPPGLKGAPAGASELSSHTPEREPQSCGKAERAFDEDELFLLSYVPALKRLTPQKRAAAKMQIQQIMFDAEFKEQK
ncbi:uncharacterized protein [Pseudorasbora parva]|uniref:uncharacterized protein n=1 Tax=Pseudorasbora parva TaxID=51549 RepID=UPI00351E5206